jgi:hypothetical protein
MMTVIDELKLRKENNMGRYDAYSSPHSDEQEAEVTPASLREDSVTQQSLEKVEASTYDTLYANAEVGDTPFSNVRVTEMTLDELVAFSKPSGEYGKWVKPRLGKDTKARAQGLTSTPMGKYQIVGTTLRSLMKQMNLPGDTLFNEETQDAMFLFLAKDAIKRGDDLDSKIANLRNVWEGFKNIPKSDLAKVIQEVGV